MEPETAEAPEETPSEGAPVDDDAETPSDEDAPGDEPGEDEDEPPQEGADEDAGDPAVKNLTRKFGKDFERETDPKKRESKIAGAYWDKANYAAKLRREFEAYKRRNPEGAPRPAAAAAPEKEPTPPPPDPDLQELDTRINALAERDKQLYAQSNQELVALNETDADIAKLQGKLEDAVEAGDTHKKDILESRIEAKQAKRESILRRYQDLTDSRSRLSYDYERLNKDKSWLQQVISDRQTRQEKDQRELAEFKVDFPEQVDSLIEAAATRAGIPPHLVEDLFEEVNEGLLVDLHRAGEADLDDVDIPSLVQARVDRFVRVRDLAGRQRFSERSAAKRRVTTPASRPPSAPARPAKPVPPAQMTSGGLGPKMRAAREYLVSRGY